MKEEMEGLWGKEGFSDETLTSDNKIVKTRYLFQSKRMADWTVEGHNSTLTSWTPGRLLAIYVPTIGQPADTLGKRYRESPVFDFIDSIVARKSVATSVIVPAFFEVSLYNDGGICNCADEVKLQHSICGRMGK